jgi:hypothetical protein
MNCGMLLLVPFSAANHWPGAEAVHHHLNQNTTTDGMFSSVSNQQTTAP